MASINMIFALPFIVVDLCLYILSFAWVSKLSPARMRSVKVGDAVGVKGPPRRSPGFEKGLLETNYQDDANTVFDVVYKNCQRFGDAPAQLSRKFIELKKLKETDRFPSKIYDKDNSTIETITYSQFAVNIRNFGAGLRAMGMEPVPKMKKGQQFDDLKGNFKMVIFEDTCRQWSTALHGAFSQSMTVATCYATLGEEAVITAVNETESSTLFLNWKKAARFAELSDRMPSLKYIIASTYEMSESDKVPKGNNKIAILSSDDVLELGEKNVKNFSINPPSPSDIAVLMYTSGSTGKPKGVMMPHSCLVASISGMRVEINVRELQECYVSYLPLAHVLAMQCENAMYASGAKVCYTDPRELPKSMPIYGPTLHAGVPKVWDLFKNGLLSKLKGESE